MNYKFWNNKKVFITGHTGFKGSWLVLLLKELGADVTGYALTPPTSPNLFELADASRDIESIIGDIRDKKLLLQSIKSSKPEIVIHMAAQPLVRLSYENPVETFETNIIGTANLLESIKAVDSVRVCVNVTTDKCYENKEWDWGYRENEPLGGYDPYSSSKACSEIITASYRRSFFRQKNIAVATARAGNVIGGGDWAKDRLIPDIFKAWLNNEKVVIRSPNSIRPWQFVLEPLSGYLKLAEKLWENPEKFASAWNFGPYDNDTRTVGQILTIIAEKLSDFQYEIHEADNLHEAKYLKLDCSKARTSLSWKPLLDVDNALKWTTEWYENFEAKSDMRKVTLEQIVKYLKLGEL